MIIKKYFRINDQTIDFNKCLTEFKDYKKLDDSTDLKWDLKADELREEKIEDSFLNLFVGNSNYDGKDFKNEEKLYWSFKFTKSRF